MRPLDDNDCLQQYVASGSEEAFSRLVSRYMNLVYSVALRHRRDAGAAEEITQAVFILFAQKARQLPKNVLLAGWLYETARFCAANYARSEARRREREHKAVMENISDGSSPDQTWTELAPFLEETMARLRGADRNAILLRFFEGRSFAEVAAMTGTTENAAKKRVAHGLEKLRSLLAKRGVHCTAQVLSERMACSAVQAVPAGLAMKLAALALDAHARSAATGTVAGALVKHVSHAMFKAQFKAAMGFYAGILVLGGAAWTGVAWTTSAWPTAREIARESRDTYATLTSYSESGTVLTGVDQDWSTNAMSLRLQRPGFYRVDSGNEHYMGDGIGDFHARGSADTLVWTNAASSTAAFRAPGMWSPAIGSVPALFFGQEPGDFLKAAASGQDDPRRERDATVDGAQCYVIMTRALLWKDNQGNYGSQTNWLWIDKKTRLVRRSEQIIDKPTVPSVDAARRLVSVQIHRDIVVNRAYMAADFRD